MPSANILTSSILVDASQVSLVRRYTAYVLPSSVEISSFDVDARPARTNANIASSEVSIKSSYVGSSYQQTIVYPSIKPTQRDYAPPSHAVSRARTMNNGVSVSPLASEPGRAVLSLIHENIPDYQAEQICKCHDDAMTSARPIMLPPEVFAGLSDKYKNRIQKNRLSALVPPGSLVCIPDPKCPTGTLPEYRWLRDGVIASGFRTANYVVSRFSDIKPDGSGVSIVGQSRCGSGPWRTLQSVFTGEGYANRLWEFASPPAVSRSADQCPGCATAKVELRSARKTAPALYRPVIKIPSIPFTYTEEAQYQVWYSIDPGEPWFFLPPACLTYTLGGGGAWEDQIPEAEVEVVSEGPPLVTVQKFYRYINGVRTLTCSRQKFGMDGHHIINVLGSRYRATSSDPWTYIDYINGQPAPRT